MGGHSSQESPSVIVTALGPNSVSTGATFAFTTSAAVSSSEMHKPVDEHALLGEKLRTL
jgi:hypothetical protein